MNTYKFCVDDKPYCVFEHEMEKINAEFINGINSDYLHFICTQNEKVLNDENIEKKEKHFAAVNLRINYGQALETLFALIFATIQAPNFVPGWMLRYRNFELNSLVQKVMDDVPIKTKFYTINEITWDTIIGLILGGFSDTETATKQNVVAKFSELLNDFAIDFLDNKFLLEYNSLKHGNRANYGGLKLKIKNNENWNEILKSDYGTSFLTFNNVQATNNHFVLEKNHVLWNPEDIFFRINAVGVLLFNIASFLKAFNKTVPKDQIQFRYFIDDKGYSRAWKNQVGTGNFVWHSTIDISTIKTFSDDEIYDSYVKKHSNNKK